MSEIWITQLEADLMKKCKELEEENKTLKLIQETNEEQIKNDIKERDELREEIKKWKMVADENGTHYDMLEEENKELHKIRDNREEKIADLEIEICKLREENKNLKEKIEQFKKWVKSWTNIIERLEEENERLEFDIEARKELKKVREKKEEKLQIEIWWLIWERDGLKIAVDKLKEEISFLEECLDRKEKLNEWYRKQIDSKRLSTLRNS